MSSIDSVKLDQDESTPELSVVICTYNPYKDYLHQTLIALSCQTLPTERWELIIIDNGSDPAIATELARLGHSKGRVVVESKTGGANARMRGIIEASAPLILFVDDDNVLAPDYCATALEIGASRPFLGAWGAGKILPHFEVTPDPRILPFTKSLSLRSQDQELWSNLEQINDSTPMGAGMCFRAEVGHWWVEKVQADPFRRRFGPGDAGACEDSDISMASSNFGMGSGIFPSLRITHLIPKRRCQEEFLLKHAYEWNYSVTLFDTLRHPNSHAGENRLARWLRLRARPLVLELFQGRLRRRINARGRKGIYDALNEMDGMSKNNLRQF